MLSRTSALLSRGGANASLTFRLPPRSTLQVQNYLLQLACIKLTQGPSFQATSAQPSYATSPAKAMRTSPSMPTGARLGSPSSGPGRGVAPGGSRDESLLPSLRRLLSGNLSSPRGSPGSSPRGGARSPPSGGRSPIGRGGGVAAAAARVMATSRRRFPPPSLTVDMGGRSPWLDRPSPSPGGSQAALSEGQRPTGILQMIIFESVNGSLTFEQSFRFALQPPTSPCQRQGCCRSEVSVS